MQQVISEQNISTYTGFLSHQHIQLLQMKYLKVLLCLDFLQMNKLIKEKGNETINQNMVKEAEFACDVVDSGVRQQLQQMTEKGATKKKKIEIQPQAVIKQKSQIQNKERSN